MNPLRRRIHRSASLGALALALGLAGALPAAAGAASPAFGVTVIASPSHFVPGDSSGTATYVIAVKNVGGAPTDGSPITIVDTLSAGVTLHPGGSAGFALAGHGWLEDSFCDPTPPLSCTVPGSAPDHERILQPGAVMSMTIPVDIAPGLEGTTATNTATVSGGGAASAQAFDEVPISSTPAPFGFQGARASLTDADGNPFTQAGGRPYQLNTFFLLNSVFNPIPGGATNPPAAQLKDVKVELPKGLVVNPNATPALCTQAELEANAGLGPLCPDASAIGLVHPILDGLFGYSNPGLTGALYNMVPPPGSPAMLGFDIGPFGNEVQVLIDTGVDSAGDYQLFGEARDLTQYVAPAGADIDIWGDPTDPSHDPRRGACALDAPHYLNSLTCPVPGAEVPLLTMPSACSGPLETSYSVDSWEDPGNFITAIAETADANGNPQGVEDCSALDFDPTLKARPTTNVADSPSGLDVDLHVPQSDHLNTRATSNLKRTVVTLPEGLVINPSSANGLGACSSAQIGLTTAIGEAPIHFSAASPSCPDAAKIGTVEVTTPLLDAPLPGAVYIARPHDNPFDSLLAIYIVIDDPQTGIVAKLAGHVVADTQTGRLTTTFEDNPQLPFSDFRLDFKAGPHGVLRTPAACGDYQSTSELSPWSGTAPVSYQDDYSITQSPSGACASSEADQPNAPSFDAGTLSPIAKAFSPFVMHLRRADGSQRFSAVTVSPPQGLVAQLAGVGQCSDASLAAAAQKSGAGEKAAPSCPASSRIGSVVAGAGAGPSPYHAPGEVYLAGPYKGAPLSLATVIPAVAGPFDLGTVVTRVAVYVDPKTTKITAVSDRIPSILEGIPLDVRSVDLSLDRDRFAQNGTSCDPSSVDGQLTSLLGQLAQLSSRFQLGECAGLGFKPRMVLRLRGGTARGKHPQLTAAVLPRAGDANIASVSVAFPRSEFLANEHIRTVCTRADFAADNCPTGSIYGTSTVFTPLLDYPLTGNVYLRTGNNLLPDVVPDLRGPAYQPLRIEAAGRTDSFNQGIRNTFDFFPDAPFSRAVLKMQGGRKGLLVNSRNICARTYRATVKFTAHNGKTYTAHPKLRAQCKSKKRKKGVRRGHRRAGR